LLKFKLFTYEHDENITEIMNIGIKIKEKLRKCLKTLKKYYKRTNFTKNKN